MSRSKTIALILLLVVAAVVTVAGSVYVANQTTKEKTAAQACGQGSHTTHKVTIKGGEVSPEHTNARRCDALVITNTDDTNRLMAFGIHDSHQPYDGIEERLLGHAQSLKVTLIDTGKFKFHDHLHDDVEGTFTVR